MYMPSLFGENLFDSFFDDFARPVRREIKFCEPAGSAMKTDVKEKDDAYELDIELPGYNKDNVKAELKDGFLTVSATVEKNNDEKDKDGRYIRRERYSGSCSRSFYVGENVTEADIKAKFDNGILKINVPKIEAKPEVEQNHYVAIEG